MYENEKDNIELLIPANVATRFEFFPGFGWKEFKIFIITMLIGVLLFFLSGLLSKTIRVLPDTIILMDEVATEDMYINKQVPLIPNSIRFFIFILIPGVISFLATRQEPSSGMSLIYIYKSSKEFRKQQKRYLYRYNSGAEDKI